MKKKRKKNSTCAVLVTLVSGILGNIKPNQMSALCKIAVLVNFARLFWGRRRCFLYFFIWKNTELQIPRCGSSAVTSLMIYENNPQSVPSVPAGNRALISSETGDPHYGPIMPIRCSFRRQPSKVSTTLSNIAGAVSRSRKGRVSGHFPSVFLVF